MPLSSNLGTLTSWNSLDHSRPATGVLYLFLYIYSDKLSFPFTEGSNVIRSIILRTSSAGLSVKITYSYTKAIFVKHKVFDMRGLCSIVAAQHYIHLFISSYCITDVFKDENHLYE